MINDWVHLDKDSQGLFIDMVKDMYPADATVPADLLIANTVPLREVVTVFNNVKMTHRIIINDELPKAIQAANIGDRIDCGTLTIDDSVKVSSSICIVKGKSDLFLDTNSYVINGQQYSRGQVSTVMSSDWVQRTDRLLTYAYLVWYGIQIALLNPYVKDVFRTETIRKTGFNPNGKKRKSIVKYIRHHYLNPGALSPKTEAGQLLRKTMAWYVCGHWRHYQDGKTIFIQPYWKGPLRETKVCDPRERVVV